MKEKNWKENFDTWTADALFKKFQIRDRKKIKSIFIKNTFNLSVECNLYDLHLKTETVRSIYKLFRFVYSSMWVKFDKTEVTQELTVQHTSSVWGRKSLFSPDNPVLSCQRHSLSSNSGMNDGEADKNRKQGINLETFLFKHFSIISCLTKAADAQKRPPVHRVNTSLIKGMEITVSKRLSHRPNLF